jgi:cellulose synthase/poly-beta-1,6-N-acetylglucosamine synthase-like glycosyltransferase
LVNLRGLAVLLIDALILAVIILKPLTRNYDDSDAGSGNHVVMKPPLRPSYQRCAAFVAISFVVSVLLVGIRYPSFSDSYHNFVAQLLLSVVPEPSVVNGFADTLVPVFQVSVIAFGLAFALAFRASVARRLMILLNVLFFLLISAVVDALFGVFVLVTGLPLGPTPIINLLVQYLIAGIVMFRVAFTSFELPKKTQLPLRRGHDLADDVILVICVLVATSLTVAAATLVIEQFGRTPLIAAAVALSVPPYVLILITVLLGTVRLIRPRRIEPTDRRPPVEVIIPAFNEEICIADLLMSIDAAAERYQGPVKVILCDDGSLDDTRLLASQAIESFRFAMGEIVEGGHHGKSGALNRALARCRADFVYRVDADCTVDPDCFLYSVPYFLADPSIGIVGAFTLPTEPYTTWIDRMRLFEMVIAFGMARPAADVVDGIACIPGTFTAFRREAAIQIGGFVEGMYGEDVDFTCAIARVGYRVVIDTRVRSYEDVPNTQQQLRVQRVRWNRGSTMAYARYIPIVTGLAGCRYWFFATRASAKRFLVPLHITTLLYVIAVGFFEPSSRVNLARVAFVLLFQAIPAVIQTTACTIYYGKSRYLGWLPLRYFFIQLKHFYGLEAFLSFNARPVITPRIAEALRAPGRRDAPIESAEVA